MDFLNLKPDSPWLSGFFTNTNNEFKDEIVSLATFYDTNRRGLQYSSHFNHLIWPTNFYDFCLFNNFYGLLDYFLSIKDEFIIYNCSDESLIKSICSTRVREHNLGNIKSILTSLINKNKKSFLFRGRHGFSILHLSAINQSAEFNQFIINLLSMSGINPTELLYDESKRTPLFYIFINDPQKSSTFLNFRQLCSLYKIYKKFSKSDSLDVCGLTAFDYSLNYNCPYNLLYLMSKYIDSSIKPNPQKLLKYLSFIDLRVLNKNKTTSKTLQIKKI